MQIISNITETSDELNESAAAEDNISSLKGELSQLKKLANLEKECMLHVLKFQEY